MKILLFLEDSDFYEEVDVNINDNLESLFILIRNLFGLQINQIKITINDKNITSSLSEKLSNLNISEGSIVMVKKLNQPKPITNIINNNLLTNLLSNNNTNQNKNLNFGDVFDNTMKMISDNNVNLLKNQANQQAKIVYDRCINNSDELSILFNTDEKLAEAVASGSVKLVEEVIFERMKIYQDKQTKDKEEYKKLVSGNTDNPEVQKKIELYIHRQRIQENKQLAIEHFPESFFSTHHMLYIPLEINNFKVIALVDTGAQSTIMSVDIAHKCGLFNLIDTDYKGKAIGVGESTILGVIHCAQIKINNNYIMAKITVIENISIGFILGLDNMRSHRCIIELSSNSLKFTDAGFDIKFLSDGEAKKLKESNEEYNYELLKKKSVEANNTGK